MAELRDLYQEVILEHSKAPRNYRTLAAATTKAEGFNPLCGDRCTVYLCLKDDVIEDIAFQGSGCAISRASASMMTQSLKGKTTREAEELYERFHGMVTGENGGHSSDVGKLAVFAGVSEFPARVKCATLAWHTFKAALHGEQKPVTTE
ncbi:MAG TPA: SUF system NifU family Fe-S cluster assembly protein [Pseudacidobacterium sp.]|jgi:nitrogen fixation NifU-like protein|nr:SUF system NifU family Fe-S cluster assembly protein [Pseudacidobacterium sp.]